MGDSIQLVFNNGKIRIGEDVARLGDLPINRTDLFKCMFEFLISRGKSSRLERFGLTKPFGSPETTLLGPSFSNLSAHPPPPFLPSLFPRTILCGLPSGRKWVKGWMWGGGMSLVESLWVRKPHSPGGASVPVLQQGAALSGPAKRERKRFRGRGRERHRSR